MLEQEITLTFKEDINGFTTFKSYIPDWGLSMNNRYYTFKLGTPWEHNIETNEVITEIDLTVPITITYERIDTFSKAKVFELTGDIGGLGLRTDDQLLVTIYDETEGKVYYDREASIPDPDQDLDNDDNPEIHLDGGNVNADITPLSSGGKYFITEMKRRNKGVVQRNIFYDNLTVDGAAYESVVEFVINNDPSVVKQFKTLGYEGIGLWDFQVYTDVESEVLNEDDIPKRFNSATLAGIINKGDLVEREGKFFANIRGNEQDVTNLDFSSISVQGIGKGSPTGLSNENRIKLTAAADRDVRNGYGLYFFNNLSIGDAADNYDDQLYYAGKITAISADRTEITYDLGQSGVRPNTGDFFLYAKNNLIEKSGVKGSYAHVIMTNDDAKHAEVFSVNSEVVASSQ